MYESNWRNAEYSKLTPKRAHPLPTGPERLLSSRSNMAESAGVEPAQPEGCTV